MEERGADVLTERFGEWQLVFARQPTDGEGQSWTVQVELDGHTRARLSLSNAATAGDRESIATLREKARCWVVDYESRAHSGDTDFGAP
ncbi:MAG: hypothetical protein KA795_16275 [Burkholderiaceae bacterium]|nr:hypothetical protein [Burkholderiaceae bacterium]